MCLRKLFFFFFCLFLNKIIKTLLQQGISEPVFYDDLVYKFKTVVWKPSFSNNFKR